jgi:hypothetical protein
MPELRGAAKGRQTQWATQFLAAAELIRRGYTVSFTQGNNTPIADLMVGSPSSKLFWVDVKGLSKKNSWMITPKKLRDDLFYVLVLLSHLAEKPKERVPDRFFILTQAEANEIEAASVAVMSQLQGVDVSASGSQHLQQSFFARTVRLAGAPLSLHPLQKLSANRGERLADPHQALLVAEPLFDEGELAGSFLGRQMKAFEKGFVKNCHGLRPNIAVSTRRNLRATPTFCLTCRRAFSASRSRLCRSAAKILSAGARPPAGMWITSGSPS